MTPNQKWQIAALEDLEKSPLSYNEIAAKYGRSRDTIIKLQKRYKIIRRVPISKVGLSKTETMRSLSPQHRALGSRITVFRGTRNYSDVADLFNVSRYVLKRMELGAHDFTLTQLLTISKIIGLDLFEMITPISLMTRTRLEKHAD